MIILDGRPTGNFRYVCKRYGGVIRTMVNNMCIGEIAGECQLQNDIMQVALYRLSKIVDSPKLYKAETAKDLIGKHVNRAIIRINKKYRPLLEFTDTLGDAIDPVTTESKFEMKEAIQQIHKTIRQCKHSQLLWDYFVEGIKPRSIMQKHNLSEKQYDGRRSRAIAQLRKKLTEKED